MPKKTKRPDPSGAAGFWDLARTKSVTRESIMQHIMDFDEGNVTEENVHDIAQVIRETGLHRSAGRYGRFLDWYDNEYQGGDNA